MGFLTGVIQSREDGRVAIRSLRELPLGGRHGLLARILPPLAQAGDGNWSLSARELLEFDNPDAAPDLCILFELAPRPGAQKTFLSLVDVCGRTMSILTDALFHFKLLGRVESATAAGSDMLLLGNGHAGPEHYEQMRLEGGSLGGTWAWAEPPQALGATVLHPISP